MNAERESYELNPTTPQCLRALAHVLKHHPEFVSQTEISKEDIGRSSSELNALTNIGILDSRENPKAYRASENFLRLINNFAKKS